jgi:glycosyltransferase involved in cell wall biosynthesis
MRVLVDGRVLQDRYHGIGRYTMELLRALPVSADVEVVVLTPPLSGRLPVHQLRERADVRLVSVAAPVVSLSGQVWWPRLLHRWSPDVVLEPYHLAGPWLHVRVPVVIVVHDCIFETDPRFAPNARTRRLYQLATSLSLATADAVATISHTTRADLRRFYGVCVPKDNVIPHAVGREFRLARAAPAVRPDDLPHRFILHVGVRRPHKDHATLIKAFHVLRQRQAGVSLVLVGESDERFPDAVPALVSGLGLDQDVLWFPRVSEHRLIELYRHAELFAFPSLIEGFGLPVLEAMAAGTPVVASDAPAVVEASAGAALVVPRADPAAWSNAMERVLREPSLAEELILAGKSVVANTTWRKSALAMLDLLRTAAGQSAKEAIACR